MSRGPVVVDTVVLSNFASSRSVETLVSVLDRPTTVPAVQQELERGASEGYEFADTALDAVGEAVPLVEPPGRAVQRYGREVDSGEAAVLAVAADRDGVAATDDKAARSLAREEGVPVTGSLGVVLRAIEVGDVSTATADEWLRQWIERTGYFSPVDSVEELL